MVRKLELQGQRFGRLTVMHGNGREGGRTVWLCRCDCGNELRTLGIRLTFGNTKSCGCLQRDKARASLTTHGLSDTQEYATWQNMLTRCYNRNSDYYPDYGGRGITVCNEWRENFEAFYRDMGDKPEGTTLDRENNSLGYSKGNCRWATASQQANNKRSNVRVHYMGTELTINQWARRRNIERTKLAYRLNNGWSIAEALGFRKRSK